MSFQAAVIGGGPGGYVAAIRLSQLGFKTALVEKDELGGECTNWGCIPSKYLIGQAKKIMQFRELAAKNIVNSSFSIDMAKISQSNKQVVEKLRQGIAYLLKANGVTFIRGHADIAEPGKIFVQSNGSQQTISADNIVVASGTEPSSLPTIPFDHRKIIDYRTALFLDKIPEKLLVVGGGAIGLELGTVYAHLGTKVTVVEIMDQVLPGFDADAARLIRRSLEKIGIRIFTKTTVASYSDVDDGVEVVLSNDLRDGFDYVLVAVGKRASQWARKLSEVGVEIDEKGYIKTDERMATSVDGIYAVGDVTGPPFLAHKAYRQGIVAAEAIAGMETKFDGLVPYGVFTSPEVAFVGLSSSAAKEMGYEVGEARFPFAALGRAIADGEEGFVKIVSDRKTSRVLGAVVVGPHATEIISVITTAIKAGVKLEELSETIFIHPTYSEAIAEAVHLLEKKAIHYVSR
ncbi:MAG: dihydrolipoyl dehydrogenase [Candidatus Caldarchaeum sp.]|nr:dihydrolipoyl dehydrogenase [Candidatus Caldarchaeum sp.]MDW8435524.1 dihydrolipoyl dehydrogenase [Candidatus Caldarchaeum sp.]